MELLERETYLTEMHGLLQQAMRGKGGTLFLSGEAGVGKSALTRAFSDQVRETVRILAGSCDPLSTPRPLGPLLDMSGEMSAGVRPLIDASSSRTELFAAVLADLTTQLPALMIVEDTHWADESTLDLLRYLARRLGASPALMVVTFRDDELGADHPMRRVLGDLATTAGVRRLALRPLSAASVTQMAGDSAVDAHELFELTGGNPFYVTEVLAIGGTGVPATVRDAVLARISRLSDAAKAMIELGAVITPPIETPVLEALGVASAQVEEGLASGVLVPHNRNLMFRHELARRAVLDVISPTRAANLHRQILGTLAYNSPADLPRLAHHAAGALDREAILTYAPAAAERAVALGSHRDAEALYALTNQHAQDLPPRRRAELLMAWSVECYYVDDVQKALDSAHEALTLLRQIGDKTGIGDCLRHISLMQLSMGHQAEGEAAIGEALAVLEQCPPGPELAELYGLLAGKTMVAWEMDTAIVWGRKAIALAESLGETETMVRTIGIVGAANYLVEGPEEGAAQVRHSLELALEHNLENVASFDYTNLAAGQCEMYRFAEADAAIEEGLAYCTARDLDHRTNYLKAWRAVSFDYQGRWREALEVTADVLRQPRLAPITRLVAVVAAGRVRSRQGHPEAEALLDEALELALPTGELQRLGPVRTARAEHLWLAGDLERVRDEVAPIYDMAIRSKHQWYVGQIAFWLWRAGENPVLPPNAFPPYAAQIAGRWREAAARWRKIGSPFEAALALADSPDEADLRYAHAELTRLGAVPAAAIVAGKLRDLGAARVPRGPRPSTQANPYLLTNREMEVLALLVEGRTTTEITDQLFLSPRTVGHHISAILTKLKAPTREEAIATAILTGLLPK